MNTNSQKNFCNVSVVLKPTKRSRQASYSIGNYDVDEENEKFNSTESEDSWMCSNQSSSSESTQSSMSSFSQFSYASTEKSKLKNSSSLFNLSTSPTLHYYNFLLLFIIIIFRSKSSTDNTMVYELGRRKDTQPRA